MKVRYVEPVVAPEWHETTTMSAPAAFIRGTINLLNGYARPSVLAALSDVSAHRVQSEYLALTRDTRAAVDEGRAAVHDTIGAMENTAAKVAEAVEGVIA